MKWHTHEKLLCINKLIKPFEGDFTGVLNTKVDHALPISPYVFCQFGKEGVAQLFTRTHEKKKRKFPGSGVVSDWSKQQFYFDWRKIRFDLPWDCDPCSFKTTNVRSQHTLPGFSFSPKLVLVSSH